MNLIRIGLLGIFLSLAYSCGDLLPLITKDEARKLVPIKIDLSDNEASLSLHSTLSNVKMKITDCVSLYSPGVFDYNGTDVNFFEQDTGCKVSICSFRLNNEDYPNPSPPCGVFNNTVGSLTQFTGSGATNPNGDDLYIYVSKQPTGPIDTNSTAEFYVLANSSFNNFNLPIAKAVVQIKNDNPSNAPFTVADSDSSVSFKFQLLYPNPPPTSSTSINYKIVGSALPGVDYVAPSGTLSIPANQSSATLTLSLINNTLAREMQDLGVFLDHSSGFQGQATYYGYGSPTVMITNSDTSIAPTGSNGLVFQGKPSSIVSSSGTVTSWSDGSGSGFGISFSASGSPILNSSGSNQINGYNTIGFNGSNYLYLSSNSTLINSSGSGYSNKVVAMVFKTSSDVTTRQVLYQQGNSSSGLNIYIYNNNIYGTTWASSGTDIYTLASIAPNTAYSFSLNFNNTNSLLKIFLSGLLVGQVSTSSSISSSTSGVGIGGVAGTTKFENNTTTSSVTGFTGSIAELLHYNLAGLSDTQVSGLHGYLDNKYNLTSLPAVTVSAVKSKVSENNSAAKGFLISRSRPSANALTVYYSLGGTAVAGTNYQSLGSSISIPAYSSSTYTSLVPINNGVSGDSHSLTLTLWNDASNGDSPTNYTGARNSASLDIVDYSPPLSATLVAWFDAALGVSTSGSNVNSWSDQSGNSFVGTAPNNNHRPSYNSSSPPYLIFNGTSTNRAEILTLNSNSLLDSASSYTQKTFAFAIKTGSNVSTKQVIYKQGNTTHGLNLVISGGNLYFTGYGSGWSTSPNSISTSISTNTLYVIICSYDQPKNQLRGKINQLVISPSTSGVGTLTGVASSTTIGASASDGMRFFDNSTTNSNYNSYLRGNHAIYEILLFNGVLNSNDYLTLESYLFKKYGISN